MKKIPAILRILADTAVVLFVGLVVWKLTLGAESPERAESVVVPTHAPPSMTNSIGMALVRIPEGEMTTGSGSSGAAASVGKVRFAGNLWMGRNEVSQAQFEAVLGTNPSRFRGEDLPVDQVTWDEAEEFCRRLEAREGRLYRLPTETEWEYACRAGSRSAFCFGDDDTRLGEFAWYDACAGHKTHPIGGRKPNGWGIHDMHGNVWEWCADPYREDVRATEGPEDPAERGSGTPRVRRGGCWYNRPVFCRSSRRDFDRSDRRDDGIGFRVVCDTSLVRP